MVTRKKISELTVKERMGLKSPDLFIKIQKWAMFFIFAAPILSGALSTAFPDNPFVMKVTLAIGAAVTLMAAVAKIIAKIPVDDEAYDADPIAIEVPDESK